ncbi:MAG: molybdopterin molybdotransferase MoeA [Chloroflexi bacterium]|nr:molybdopterin molybdotransferase MoeA [Chloroflexota bacterium]
MDTSDSYPMLSVEEARDRVLAAVSRLDVVEVPILDALGLVLAEDVRAEADIPPHDNSAMDGYAVRSADLIVAKGALPRLRVIGELAAGYVWDGTVSEGEALRIMTGAPMPAGADTVVRFEDTERDGEWVAIRRAPRPGSNVRQAGEDVRAGEVVLRAGQALRPQEIGMLASVGRSRAAVHRRPRVAVLSTGDEVLPLDAPLAPGKIRDSNSYSIAAQAAQFGAEPVMLGIAPDTQNTLAERLHEALERRADLIVTSGGVSVGDFDLVKHVLATEGDMDFWWVNMKPGKPMAFGTLGGVPLLALPGNPVAAMISFYLFGRPAILKMLGHAAWAFPSVEARLSEGISRKDGRRHYLRVHLEGATDGYVARLTGEQGSGILSSLVAADGLAVIPEDREYLAPGSPVQVLLLPGRDLTARESS